LLILILRLGDRNFVLSQQLPPCCYVQPRHAFVAWFLIPQSNRNIEHNRFLQAILQLYFFPDVARPLFFSSSFKSFTARCITDSTVSLAATAAGAGGAGGWGITSNVQFGVALYIIFFFIREVGETLLRIVPFIVQIFILVGEAIL